MSCSNFIRSLCLLFLLISCEIVLDRQEVPEEDVVEVSFTLDNSNQNVKSAWSADENKIESLILMAYSGGRLVAESSSDGVERMILKLERGRAYNFYALANISGFSPPVSETELNAMKYEMDSIGTVGSVLPMSWSMIECLVEGTMCVQMCLERLVAKIVLSIDNDIDNLEVVGVTLKQAPFVVSPFVSGGSRAEGHEVADGDYASVEDLATLNAGESISFYMLENMQGTVLMGNEDPMQKVPSSMSEMAAACSYIEVKCRFTPNSDKEGDVCYRMYLGKDNVANFDVERNRTLSLVLTLTPSGMDIKDSWKITADYIQHITALSVNHTSLDLEVGADESISAVVYPSNASQSDLLWFSEDESVAIVNSSGVVTGKSVGQSVIRVLSRYRPEIYAECVVNVLKPSVTPEEIVFDSFHITLSLGETASVKYKVKYNDGTSTNFISYGFAPLNACSPEGWSVSDWRVVSINSYGQITPLSVGETQVNMTVGWWEGDEYCSCTSSVGVTVTSAYVVDVYAVAPVMFYNGSGGPVLIGVFSDGTERYLVADYWETDCDTMTYDETDGISIFSEESMITGQTKCKFTGYYRGFSASAECLYGKWVKDIGYERIAVDGFSKFRYRVYVIYADFSIEYVPFSYNLSQDGHKWTYGGSASSDGVLIDWFENYIEFNATEKYYDDMGTLREWKVIKI